ncbi:hypothetical protein Pelo_3836 [Pelomyxa schiedti]|nr:hypothetical protein Pelo_3836 [Pelomyxa schiedti]
MAQAVTFEFDATTSTLAAGEIVLALVVHLTTTHHVTSAFLQVHDGKPLWRLYPLSKHTRGNYFSGQHILYHDTYMLQFAIYHPERGFLWKGVMRQVVIPDKTNLSGVFEQGTTTTSNVVVERGGSIETERDVPEEIGTATSATSNTACNRTFFFSGYLAATGRMRLFTTLSDVALHWRFGEIPVEEMISVGLAADFTTYKLDGFYLTTKTAIWDFQSTSEQETSQWLRRFKELKKEVFDPRVATAADLGAERRQTVMPYEDEAPEKKGSLETTIKSFAQTKAELTKIHSATRVLCNSSEPAEYPWPAAAIAILGDMKAGKSTLCNAILGDIVLPSRKLKCTSRVTVIKAGDTREYTIKNPDGTVTEGPIQFTGELPHKAVALSADQRRETNAIGKEDAAQTKLPVSGFDFIDLPGLGENKELDAVIMNALKTVVGAIYILDINSGAVKGEDVDAIKTLLKTGIQKSVPILFVGNKVDTLFEEEVEVNQEPPDMVLDAFYSELKALAPDILLHYPVRTTSPYWAELSALRFLRIRCGKEVTNQPKYAELSQIFERRLQALIGRTLDTTILRCCEGICGPCGTYADTMISFGELQHGIATCKCFVQQLKRGENGIISQCSNLVQQAARDTLVKIDVIAKEAVFEASQSKGILLSWPQAVERSTEFTFNRYLWAALKPMWRQFVSNFFKPLSRHLRLINNNLVDCISCDESRFPIWQIVIPLTLYVGFLILPAANAIREAVCTYDTEWKESHSKECLRCIDPVKEGNRVGKELSRKLIDNASILVTAKTGQLSAILKRWNPTQPTSRDSLTLAVSSKLLGLASANGFVYGIPELKAHVYYDFYGETFDAVWRGVHVHAKKLNKFKRTDESQSVLKSILTQLCMSRIDTDPSFGIVKDGGDGSVFIVCSPEISEQLQAPPLATIMIDAGLSDAIVLPPLVNLLQGVPTVSLGAALLGLHSEVGCTAEYLADAVALCRTKVIEEGLVTRASGNGSFVGEPMTTEEAAAIVLYTKNKPKVFAALNWALRDPHRTNASLAPWKPYTKLLLTALAKLKPVTDVVAYRGFGTLPESWETYLSQSRSTNICWYGFSSISRNRAVAVAFTAMQGQRGLLLEVRSPLAYDITGFSWFGLTEAELLTPPGCNFVLVSPDQPPAAPPPTPPKYVTVTLQFHSVSSLL